MIFVAPLLVSGSLLATPILTFNTTTALSGNNANQTVGWEFDVLSPITVTGLGWFDQGADGLQMAHTVGIWDSAGDLLTSAVVQQGTTDPLDGLFRTAAITSVVLMPGTDYIIGGQNFSSNTEQLAFGVPPTTAPSISFVGGEYSGIDNLFERPTSATANTDCCWGPSFSVAPGVTSVPEPRGTVALLTTGVVLMLLVRRRLVRA